VHLLRLLYVDIEPYIAMVLPRYARPFDDADVDAPIPIPHSPLAHDDFMEIRTFVSEYLLKAAGHVRAWEVCPLTAVCASVHQ
jgi:hypothetical protein